MVLAERTAKGIGGIGELTIYDTAHRIGAYLRLAPENVYLHAGTRQGAKALGFKGSWASIPRREFPKALSRLRANEIEDCLCIYKNNLRSIP
jgi:hypothetical protein